jgi:hypothetical protein
MFTTNDTLQPVDASELATIEGGVLVFGPIHLPFPRPGHTGPFPLPPWPCPGPDRPFPTHPWL